MNKPPSKPKFDDDDFELPELDDDDAPELTPELAAQLKPIDEIPELADLAALVRKGGRPLLPSEWKKRRVTIMLDPDVLEHFKAGGKGWQTRLNATLREALGLPVTTSRPRNTSR